MKVFITYSWDSDGHKEWVRRFADQLQRNGLEVILDQYDLKPGDDRFKFMEVSVRQADCILVVCTPEYRDRANQREKGVGVETSLLTPQFYEREKGKKQFIPVIRRTQKGVSATPDYLAGLLYVDFEDDSKFDEQLEALLRHLHDKPKHTKPPLGPAPSFTSSPTRPSVASVSAILSAADVISRVLSSSRSDWTFFEEKGLYVFKPNPEITILRSEIGYDTDRFHEAWVTKFPDPVAYRETFEIRYKNTPIEERILVSVDGHRMEIPLPKSAVDLHISPDQRRFGWLVNQFQPWGDQYEEYLRRAGISTKKA